MHERFGFLVKQMFPDSNGEMQDALGDYDQAVLSVLNPTTFTLSFVLTEEVAKIFNPDTKNLGVEVINVDPSKVFEATRKLTKLQLVTERNIEIGRDNTDGVEPGVRQAYKLTKGGMKRKVEVTNRGSQQTPAFLPHLRPI